MAGPKRRSLSERNAEAIAARGDHEATTPAPQPTTPDNRHTVPARKPRTAPRRSSVYLDDDEYRDARSAYLVDFDHRQGSADSFGRPADVVPSSSW